MNAERAAGLSFAGLCAYEAVAISSGRFPTLSALCRQRRAVEAGLLALLIAHLHVEMKEAAVAAAQEAIAEMDE